MTEWPGEKLACTGDGPTLVRGRRRAAPTNAWRGLIRIERANDLIVMLIAGVTVFGVVIAALQTDANVRAATAGRQAQALSLLALQNDVGNLFELGHEMVVYRAWWDMTALEMLAQRRAQDAPDDLHSRAREAEAQRMSTAADLLTQQSGLLDVPYYDPESGYAPDVNRYYDEQVSAPRLLAGEEQAAQAEVGEAWGRKGNAYQTIITLVAITLFLHGLALTLEGCLKWGFVGLGTLNLGGIVLWALITALRPVPQVSPAAIDAYVAGYFDVVQALRLEFQSLHNLVPAKADEAVASLDRAIELHPKYASAYTRRGDAYLVKGEAMLLGGGDAATRDASLRAAADDYWQTLRLKPDDYHAHWNLGWALYLLGEYDRAIESARQVLVLAPQLQLGARFVVAANMLGLGHPEEALAECRRGIEHAAAHPLSTDAYYFRQAIRDLERLEAVRPQAGMEELKLLLEQAFVSLQYRDTPIPGATQAQLNNLDFASPVLDNNGRLMGYRHGTEFPADTEQVVVSFDYNGLKDGDQVVLTVQHNEMDQPFLSQVVTWQDGSAGHSTRLAVEAPVDHTMTGLWRGRYEVEIYVEGNLRSAGEFTVE
jgi:tetratricopeptide (TPR) repeat protein